MNERLKEVENDDFEPSEQWLDQVKTLIDELQSKCESPIDSINLCFDRADTSITVMMQIIQSTAKSPNALVVLDLLREHIRAARKRLVPVDAAEQTEDGR